MEASRPPLDNNAPRAASGADPIGQPPGHYSYGNIEQHPEYRKVCRLYAEVRNRTLWSPYAIKRHIAVLLQLPLQTVTAIVLDNYGID
jgi:hypothetical protein